MMVSLRRPNVVGELEQWLVAQGFRRTKSGPTVPGGSTLVDAYHRTSFSIEIVRHQGSWYLQVAFSQADDHHPFDLMVIRAALSGQAIEIEPMPLKQQCEFVRDHLAEMSALASGGDPELIVSALNALRETRARVRMPGLRDAQ